MNAQITLSARARKKLALVILLILASSMISYRYGLANVPTESPYYLDVPFGTASYYIGKFDNGSTYAVKGDNWKCKWVDDNSTYVIQRAIDDLTNGGTIFLKEIQLPSAVTYGSDILIIEEYQGRRTEYPAPTFLKSTELFWWGCNWFPGVVYEEVGGNGNHDYGSARDAVVLLSGNQPDRSYSLVLKGFTVGGTWNKRRNLRWKVYIQQSSSQDISLMAGYTADKGGVNTAHHVGFYIVDNRIYGAVGDGHGESRLYLYNFTTFFMGTLEVDFTPAKEARFYVDGIDKGTITTNLPSGTTNAGDIRAVISPNEIKQKIMQVYEMRFWQES